MRAGCVFVILANLLLLSSANSMGKPFSCDIHYNLGCQNWVNGNRLNCSDANRGEMYWASKPFFTNEYTLRAGDADPTSDLTSYIPGEYITLHLQVHHPDKKYRGILLYAVDGNNEKVGDWGIPMVENLFWAPWQNIPGHECQKALLHASATLKPYHTVFRFKAPEAGTGQITFKCLIKQGDANTGAFYFPNQNGELKLNEATEIPSAFTNGWVARTELGQSCTELCAAQGQPCDATVFGSGTGGESSFNTYVLPHHVCAFPLLSGCNQTSPASSTQDLCFYRDPECGAEGRATTPSTCDTKSTDPINGRRFCRCGTSTAASTSASSSTTASSASSSQASTTNGVSSVSEDLSSASSSLTSNILGLLLSLGFCSTFSKSARSINLVIIVCLAITLLPSCSAHNWIASPSRVPFTASTAIPCVPRRSSVPHVQVSSDQTFQVEWVTGHEDFVYFVLIAAEDYEKLDLILYNLEDYIAKAPAGTDLSGDTKYQRYHRTPNLATGQASLFPFVEIVTNTSADYLERPSTFPPYGEAIQWRYPPQWLKDDRVVSYVSQQYPEILAVWKYQITSGQPIEVDTARFWIPKNNNRGSGEYILHYFWRGYRDCIDLSYLDRPEPVENIYGKVPADGQLYSARKIDHCMFVNPNRVFGPPREAIVNPSVCINKCLATSGCAGVNVFPYALSKKEFYPHKVNIFQKMINDSFRDFEIPVEYDTPEEAQALLQALDNSGDDTFVCLPVWPRNKTNTADIFVVTDDPADPIFYSTCYEIYSKLEFIGYEAKSEDVSIAPWKYQDRCVSCETQIKGSMTKLPNWELADKCVHCDLEPFDASTLMINEPTVQIVKNASIFAEIPPNFGAPPHTNCSANTTCSKQLKGLGYAELDFSDEEECGKLIEKHPECSRYMAFGEIFNPYVFPTLKGCRCWMKEPACCGTVPPTYGFPSNLTTFVLYETVAGSAPPDPTCSTGLAATDGTNACCSGVCGYCLDFDAYYNSAGFCCSTCIPEYRTCDLYGPPCTMTKKR